MSATPSWLSIERGSAPLIVSMPHTGTEIPADFEGQFHSPWLARKDTDWWVDRLYDFAPGLGATVVCTSISRSVIDVNRDPSGKSLYPGQNTTELCPTTTFDGEPLYRDGQTSNGSEIADRRLLYFNPYHGAIRSELARLRNAHRKVVLFDAHSIRSNIARLFEGELPHFNIGTNSGTSCAPPLSHAVDSVCAATPFSRVLNGRFKGGYTTRHYGEPSKGVHAIQLELAARTYMDEPAAPSSDNWPSPYDDNRAAPLRAALERILKACIDFAREET
jgi:N-formylglutamate deformylase